MSGKTRRLKRLFRHADGRAILVPIDHGLYMGPIAGIEQPLAVARKVIPGSDGLLVSPGFAGAIAPVLPSDRALILRVGVVNSLSPTQYYEAVFAGVETALRLDADGLIYTTYLGNARDDQAIHNLGQLIETAHRYEMPVITEFLPTDDKGEWPWDQVACWARLGFELGADAIKTVYTGDPDSFRRVVEGCPVPILIAGGPAVGSMAGLLQTVAGAITAGAAGLAIGRRVWQADDPAGLLETLGRLIHSQVALEETLARIG